MEAWNVGLGSCFWESCLRVATRSPITGVSPPNGRSRGKVWSRSAFGAQAQLYAFLFLLVTTSLQFSIRLGTLLIRIGQFPNRARSTGTISAIGGCHLDFEPATMGRQRLVRGGSTVSSPNCQLLIGTSKSFGGPVGKSASIWTSQMRRSAEEGFQ